MYFTRCFLLGLFASIWFVGRASHTRTINNGDWDDTFVWQSGQTPSGVDTIFIRHYLTFSKALNFPGPVTIIIESNATLCGDYFVDFGCGTRLYNYGHLYINGCKIRDGWNYGEFWSRGTVNVLLCNMPGYGAGLQNLPPGVTKVWSQITLCKTIDTHWDGGGVNGLDMEENNPKIQIFPNPVNEGALNIILEEESEVKIFDCRGQLVFRSQPEKHHTVSLTEVPAGILMIQIFQKGKIVCRKFLHLP